MKKKVIIIVSSILIFAMMFAGYTEYLKIKTPIIDLNGMKNPGTFSPLVVDTNVDASKEETTTDQKAESEKKTEKIVFVSVRLKQYKINKNDGNGYTELMDYNQEEFEKTIQSIISANRDNNLTFKISDNYAEYETFSMIYSFIKGQDNGKTVKVEDF